MNKECLGEYFSIRGHLHYRCALDGSIIISCGDFVYCPFCGRKINSRSLGDLPIREVKTMQVLHPIHGWITLSKEIIKR